MATKKTAIKVASKTKPGKAVKSAPLKKSKSGPVSPVKPASKKVAAKKPVAKKAPAKKVVVASKVKKTVTKSPAKNTAPKLSKSGKDTGKLKKQQPVKKAAKIEVKKAAKEKLSAKNQAVKQPAQTGKKSASKKENTMTKNTATDKKTTIQKPAKQKTSETVAYEPIATTKDHKAELKKAMAKVKAQKSEEKKPKKEFVMPKTNTEKSRKYEPEFTKSVLDQSPAENTGPSMRYSDNELVEFRDLITRKLETAKKELGYLQGLITRKDQMGGDESDNRYMTMEDGSLSMEREQLSQMASRQITFIDHLEKAMMRIENKTYGICRVTGKLIDKARLRAVPHATLSIEAKMGTAK
ncbi:MAG TPA: TraR/DksA C4-type zinc finger protein [Hanamia sp.]